MNEYQDKVILILCFVLLFICVPLKVRLSDKSVEEFDAYLTRYNKSYNNTEYLKRLQVFRISKNNIQMLNSQRNHTDSAYYGLTKYSDLFPFEFLVNKFLKHTGNKPNFKKWLKTHKKDIPLKVDWREKGIISSIYNQRSCGACWAFTTIETLESIRAIEKNKLEKLSVQQMIDCSSENHGCDGGDICVLLEGIIKDNVKIVTEKVYPLTLHVGECKMKNITDGVTVRKYKCEYLRDHEEIILDYLAKVGPVSAAVNAGVWQNYLGGIIQYHCEESPFFMNHAVQIVGYDISGPTPYYIIRNSWGTDFGENGYLRIVIGKNMCGIANKVVSIYL